MQRYILAGLLGLIAAPLILAVGMWLQLRFTGFGVLIWAANHRTTAETVRQFGDPLAIVEKASLVNTWLLSPVAALLSAALARIVAQRTTWAMSVIVAVPIAVFPLTAAFGPAAIAASCLYVLVAHGGMKVVDISNRPQHASE